MDKTLKDEELKKQLENAFFLPEVVSKRIDISLHQLPQRRPNPALIRFFTMHWRKIVPTMIVLLLIAACISTTPTIASIYVTNQAMKQEAYIVHDGHYYLVTGNPIDYSELDEKVAEVGRVGSWHMKKEGDSNHFLPGSPIYEVKGKQDVIAVKKTWINLFELYIELERAEVVEKPYPEMIEGAKGDSEETSIALNNAKDQMQLLYSFPSNLERVELTLVNMEDEHFIKLYYRVPEADIEDTQGILFILQYPKEQKAPSESRFTPNLIREQIDENSRILLPDPDFNPPKLKEKFLLNSIEWHYYNNQLLRGERDGMYYEIQTQGEFTKDFLMELLNHFKSDEKIRQ